MGRTLRFAQRVVFYLAVLGVTAGAWAQDARPVPAPSTAPVGGPQDWSSRHVIYTGNGSPEDVWKLRDDPRFLKSVMERHMNAQRGLAGLASAAGSKEAELNETDVQDDFNIEGVDSMQWFQPFIPWDPIEHRPNPRLRNKHSRVDWSVSLGPTAGMALGESPAIYTANYSSPSCSGDFAVYTINATPSTTAGAGQANLVGLTNLYTTGAGNGYCSGTAPTFLFSYAIGTGGSPLSPVPSLDGTRIAWIEDRGGTDAYLHVTIWVAGQGGDATQPVAPNGTFSDGACETAGTSCDFALEYTSKAYANGCSTKYEAPNTHSDLYVDYANDTGFISANNGLLYHIINIFSTTITPSVDFCIPVNTHLETNQAGVMSGPVYDPLDNEVFITDTETVYAYEVNATATIPNFSLSASHAYGNTGNDYDNPNGPGPLLDVFNNFIYVPSAYDVNSDTSVTQLPTTLATAAVVPLGTQYTNNPYSVLYYGAFDNNYYNNGPKSAASTLYTCGRDESHPNWQDLFAIKFIPATGVVNTTPAMSYNTNVNPSGDQGVCSPLTEFYDGSNDRLFVGMGNPANNNGSNVVTMWNINTQLTNTSGADGAMPTYEAEATGYLGGTSGISADNNDASYAQAENIYFSTEDVGLGSTAVNDNTYFDITGIYADNQKWTCPGGLDGDGNAYSSNLLGGSVTWNGTTFNFGPSGNPDVWWNTTIPLPSGEYSTLTILAAAVNVTDTGLLTQTLTVNYSDGTKTSLTQSFSDWYNPLGFGGESIAKSMAYRDTCEGGQGTGPFDLYGYSFAINPNKTVESLTLPAPPSGTNESVMVLGVALSNNCGGADYCAVKLTQSALQ